MPSRIHTLNYAAIDYKIGGPIRPFLIRMLHPPNCKYFELQIAPNRPKSSILCSILHSICAKHHQVNVYFCVIHAIQVIRNAVKSGLVLIWHFCTVVSYISWWIWSSRFLEIAEPGPVSSLNKMVNG